MRNWTPRGAAITFALLTLSSCANPTEPDQVTASTPTSASPAAVSTAAAIVDLTNTERGRAGLSSFRVDARLMEAARLHAGQMADLSRLDHVLPGAQYPGPSDRLAAAGYPWQSYAENIAMGQPTAAAVVAAWMQSTGHRANILNSNLTELGAATSTDASGRPFYVQVFGRPR
ncbi:MAG TPA: CAP domain-containing protein [Vicinamibacterales bacterium]